MGTLRRWLAYARTKVESTLKTANRDLDELEAQREAATADRPWVRSDTEAPTFDEAKARIEWEAAQAARGADTDPPSAPAPSDSPSSPTGQDAETVAAQLELEERQRESAARLDAIRAELGIEPDDKAGG